MKVLVLHISAWNLGFLGCYGNDWVVTPALDRFAAEGIVFDWHFSSNPGLPQHSWSGVGAAADVAALPAKLQVGGVPFRHLVAKPSAEALVTAMEQARDAVRDLADQKRGLIWVDLPSLQPPWLVEEEILDHYFPDEEIDPEEEPIEPWLNPTSSSIDPNDLVLVERLRSTYAAVVTQLDAALGLLLEELRQENRLDDLAVVICSERGLALAEHGVIGDVRPWMHDEVMHVPFLVRLPRAAEAGRRVQELTLTVDLLPTLLELLELPAVECRGLSLAALLKGTTNEWRDYVCAGWRQENEAEYALRTRDWSLLVPIVQPEGEPERAPRLYAKPEDRWEVNDLRLHHLELAEGLEKTLRNWVEAARQPGPMIPPALPDTG